MQLAEKQELVRLLMIYQNDLVNDDSANRKELMRCEKNKISRWSKDANFKHGIKSKYEHARIIVADLSKDISEELLPNWRM